MYGGSLFRGALYAGALFGSFIAVELPPTIDPPVTVSYYRHPKGNQNLTLRAYHKLGSSEYDSQISDLIARHATAQVITGTEFTANFGTLGVSASSKIALIPVDSTLERGRLTAEGRKDISDEELVALLMEILDV